MAWGVEDLVVRFGPTSALEGVDLEAEPGAVTAVVGGDGAGKTTLLRVLLGTVRPTAGRVRRPRRERIGAVPADSGVYPDLTVEENLRFAAGAYGVRGATYLARANDLLERTGLTEARDRLGVHLSGGMRQKLALALALVHRPDLVVLDEVTTGVDPLSRADLWGMIAEAAAGGAAIVLATTYLDEAERAASVLVLDAGRPLVAGTADEAIASIPGTVARTAIRPDPARSWRRGAAWRVWLPDGEAPPPGVEPVAPDLQDAVTVAALARSLERAGR
jgi:ABC-2 type transport system ATP-binding protein